MFPAQQIFPFGLRHSPSGPPYPPPWLQALLSPPPSSASPLWKPENIRNHLRNSRETLDLLRSVQKELEMIHALKCSGGSVAEGNNESLLRFSEEIQRKGVSLDVQESISLEAAKSLYSTLKYQISLLSAVTDETCSWEERSAVVQMVQKLQKHQRNKKWKKKKRRRVAELLQKEREMYEKADQEADVWRVREIAKDIAKRKMEKMKEIAKFKANEEKKRLESELELVLVVEKLQELRAIRIQKLKKQGHFLPEEDNEFLDRVRAAVEEEERQAAAAADKDAARDAIASAEESRKSTQSMGNKIVNAINNEVDPGLNWLGDEKNSQLITEDKPRLESEGPDLVGSYDSRFNLPMEFYHYYHGSSYDMGTLIEVRRAWDAYIRPGGSRIPGHWLQPPPPANEVWASYLVAPTTKQ